MARSERLARLDRHLSAEPPLDRRLLEASGWRTTLEYRENHVRSADGRLTAVQARWRAEAELAGPDGPIVIAANAASRQRAWSRLRTQADAIATSRRWARRPPVTAGAGGPRRRERRHAVPV